MVKIKNLTNSPYDIEGHRLPAFGEIDVDISGEYLALLEASAAVSISDAVAKADPLDHDGDGKRGGAVSAELAEWRKVYFDEKNERADGRWNAERIQKELGL